MSKRELTQQQAARIKKQQEERLKRVLDSDAEYEREVASGELGPAQKGLLISHFGSKADVEDEWGGVFRCMLRQNLGALVTGDHVVFHPAEENTGVITAVSERTSVLARPDENTMKPIAANIDQIVIVTAPEPTLITTLLDSYLVAAETLQIKPIIVLNKIDLLNEKQEHEIEKQIDLYRKLGYQVIHASSFSEHGIDELSTTLNDKISVLIGQSGVGKSTLLSSLLPDEDIRIGKLSATTGKGTHTTTSSRLYHIPASGDLIDSPGIREFGLWNMEPEDIAKGFIEFRDYLGQCKFRDCKHSQEPECALQEAAKKGKVSSARLENFHKLIATV